MGYVNPKKEKALKEKMEKIGIFEKDIEEKFIRSGKPGGQNANKVKTCVYLKHIPTGIEVKCQKERSQAVNRYIARKILLEKVEELIKKDGSRRKRIEKIRKQKRKLRKRAKRKLGNAHNPPSESNNP